MVVVYCKWCYPYLLGLSKGNARVEIPDSLFFFGSVASRSQVLITHAQPFDNTRKTHTKCAHVVRARPTLKDVELFQNE